MTSQDLGQFKGYGTIEVLIAAGGDKEESVNSAVIKSLTRLASVYPNQVIKHFCEFYKNQVKVNPVQLGNVIKVLEQTCVNHMKAVHTDVATELVSAMLRAMTQHSDYQPPVQLGASAVLVAIGHEHLDLVLQSIIQQITTASVPHYTIPHTLGTLAAVNTLDIVPFIKDILSKMLPLLTLVKAEGTKQAFAYAFGHFAVAVSEHIGDSVASDNITTIKDNFVVEFSIIFDVLYNQWLHSYESKVSESVLEALGPITRLISERKFNETVNKFVLSLLALYKKQTINSYYVSQCISYLLTPSPLNPKLALSDNVITSTNHTLFNFVVLEPDYDQPQTVKNHFEVLRCFDHMAGQFPDQTIEGLLHQCKNNQEKDRMKAVIILTHLTTSSQIFIERYATKFIAILKVMTAMEHGLKMKKLLVKAIVGLVYRNCISGEEDFTMVEFIIKHCSCETPNVSKDDLNDLEDTCKSSLILLCNSATNVRSQLHDLLLKALTVDDFTQSMSTVSLCLSSLLQNNSETLGDENETVPEFKVSPDLIFIRCLTHLAEPDNIERNKNILMFLDEYSGDVHKNLKTTWAVEVQRMLKFVMKNEPSDAWHTMLIDLLAVAIEQVNNDKWVENIANLLTQQILHTKQPPLIKAVSLQFLATLSCHMANAATVEKVLKIILLALKSIPIESVDYVSKAVGIASSRHGEYILNELDAFYKEIEGKRGLKILNFMTRNSKNEAECNVSKYAAIVCYGKVAKECLDGHVLGRLGENVTAVLLEILKMNPPFDLCKATVTALYEIGMSFHTSPNLPVTVRNRWQLLHAVLEQIFNPNLDKRNVELYPIIVKASKALAKLQNSILPEARNTILRVLFTNIFGELSSFKKKYEIEGNGDKNDLLAKTLNDSLTLLHELIRELIIQSTCLSTIDDLVSLLIEWLRHYNGEIRTASVLIMQVILDAFIKNVKINYETPSKFGQMGYLLGLIVPGIADTNFPVRLTTVDCIKLIVQIQYLYEGNTLDADDECMEQLTVLHNSILTNDLEMISEYCKELCDAVCDKIPHEHTMQFLESLVESYDDEEFRSTGISAVLTALFARKGQDLFQNIERIVEILLVTMDRVGDAAKGRLLKPLLSLARHHANAVTAVLLAQKIPLKSSVIASWRHLAQDPSLAAAIVDNFLRLMNSSELYEDTSHATEHQIAALQPLTYSVQISPYQLISALGEMLAEPVMADISGAKFPELFAVLYTTAACYMGAEPPAYCVPGSRPQERLGFVPNRDAIRLSPARIAMGTFCAFLDRAECQKVREACALCLSIEHGDSAATLAALAPALGGAVSRAPAARHLSRLVPALAALARAPLPPRRAAALALLHDLLNYRCNDNEVLIETVLATLSTGWKDADPGVRACSLRGAASVAALHAPHRDRALPHALHALSRGLDAPTSPSPADNVPLAAMQGLGRLLSQLDAREARQHERELLSVAHKTRPFINTECALLREHSVRLFGLIASKVQSENLVDQAISSLPCFLLHLCDSNPAVVRASKFTLKQVFKTLNAPRSNDLVQTHLVDEGRLLLEDFLTVLLRSLARERPDSVARCLQAAVYYLNGAREDLEPYPPLLIGKLYMELYNLRETHPEHATVDDDVTRLARTRLQQLIKDPKPLVRRHSALALTYICLLEEGDHA